MKISAVIRKNLLDIAAAYGQATGMSQSDVSRKFYGRGSFLNDFKAKKHSISIDKLEKVLAMFRDEWPKEAPWPFTDTIFMSRQTQK